MKKILIADDEAIIRQPIESALRAAGYNTVTASSGVETLQAVVSSKPDLILMDVIMPDGDGAMTLQQIRMMPEYKKLPVIMLTGQSSHETILEPMDLDISAYLIKSQLSLDNLKEVIRQTLDERDQQLGGVEQAA